MERACDDTSIETYGFYVAAIGIEELLAPEVRFSHSVLHGVCGPRTHR